MNLTEGLGITEVEKYCRPPQPFVIMLQLFLTTILFSNALSHGILTSPPARQGQNIAPGTKYQPRPPSKSDLTGCKESTSPGPVSLTWTAGSTQTVKWQVTIPHPVQPGVRIDIQYRPGEEFVNLLSGFDVNKGQADVSLPAGKTSDSAVLRWIWDSASDNGYYLGCGDVRVVAATRSASPSTGNNRSGNLSSAPVSAKSAVETSRPAPAAAQTPVENSTTQNAASQKAADTKSLAASCRASILIVLAVILSINL